MSDTIRPALTPEEWASGRFAPEHWAEVHVHQSGELTVRTMDQPTIFKAPQRHAFAALAPMDSTIVVYRFQPSRGVKPDTIRYVCKEGR